jgi:hypothetical protein
MKCERCGEVNPAEIHTCSPQEPVAWVWTVNSGAGYITRGVGFDKTDIPFAKHTPLYTAPPQREWQGLTDEEKLIVNQMWNMVGVDGSIKAIETRLKEKNHDS